MTRKKSLIALFTLAIFFIGMGLSPDADARRKRVAKDPDAPSDREAKVLGWGPVKTPNRGKDPEFLVRGILLDVKPIKEKKNYYDVSILPIEVLNNHQRYITFDHFNTGLNLQIWIAQPKLKELKKGLLLEYHQYYTEAVEQAVGGAKLIAMTLHQDIQGYPAGPAAYLKTPGFFPIQYKNAIKGIKEYQGDIKSDQDVKAHLDYLATQSKDPDLKLIATNTFVDLYDSQPTGSCKLDKVANKAACN